MRKITAYLLAAAFLAVVIAPQAAAVRGGKVVIILENQPFSISFLVTGMLPSAVNLAIRSGRAASRPSIRSFWLGLC